MAEPKTRPTKASVAAFIGKVTGEERREDCRTLVRIMKKISKSDPVMWGPAIIGFGTQQLRYANGSELDWLPAVLHGIGNAPCSLCRTHQES